MSKYDPSMPKITTRGTVRLTPEQRSQRVKEAMAKIPKETEIGRRKKLSEKAVQQWEAMSLEERKAFNKKRGKEIKKAWLNKSKESRLKQGRILNEGKLKYEANRTEEELLADCRRKSKITLKQWESFTPEEREDFVLNLKRTQREAWEKTRTILKNKEDHEYNVYLYRLRMSDPDYYEYLSRRKREGWAKSPNRFTGKIGKSSQRKLPVYKLGVLRTPNHCGVVVQSDKSEKSERMYG